MLSILCESNFNRLGKGLASLNSLTCDLGHLTQARALLLTQLARCSSLFVARFRVNRLKILSSATFDSPLLHSSLSALQTAALTAANDPDTKFPPDQVSDPHPRNISHQRFSKPGRVRTSGCTGAPGSVGRTGQSRPTGGQYFYGGIKFTDTD